MTDHVAEATARWRDAQEQVKTTRAALTEAVRAARAQGATLNDLSKIVGVSRERVRQMTGDVVDERQGYVAARDVRCPKCGASVGEMCVDLRGRPKAVSNHIERYHRLLRANDGEIIPEPDEVGAMTSAMLP